MTFDLPGQGLHSVDIAAGGASDVTTAVWETDYHVFSLEFAQFFTVEGGVYLHAGDTVPAFMQIKSMFHGGEQDGQTYSTMVQSYLLPSVPLLSASTYDLLTGRSVVDSGVISLGFSSFSVPTGASSPSRSIRVLDIGTNQVIFLQNELSADDETLDFDTALLEAGMNYRLALYDTYTFDGLDYTSGINLDFSTPLSAVPEPSSYALMVSVFAIGVVVVRRRSGGTARQAVVDPAKA